MAYCRSLSPDKAPSPTSVGWRWGLTWVPPIRWSLLCAVAFPNRWLMRQGRSFCRPLCVTTPIASKWARPPRAAASSDPLNTVLSVKRLMGRGLADVKQLGEQLPYRFVGGESHMPFIETVQGAEKPGRSLRRYSQGVASAR